MAKKLTEQHPFAKKVRQIENLCFELGITINYEYNGIYLTDESGNEYQYRDVEDFESNCKNFPHMTETKLVI